MIDRNPALAELIAKLPPGAFAEHLQDMQALAEADPRAFERLVYDWSFWGRPAQQEPWRCGDPECRCQDRWTWWVILSGRGWGKTRTGAETVIQWAQKYPGCRIALVARNASDARGVMIEGESGILANTPPWFKHPDGRKEYEPSKLAIYWPNGSQAAIFTAEQPDGPRGYQHHFFWADEIAAWEKPKECWDNLMFGHRLPRRWDWPKDFRPRGLVTTTPRPIALVWSFLREMVGDEFVRDSHGDYIRPKHVHLTFGATKDNRSNLVPEFFEQIVSQYENTRLGEQELEGRILEDVPGALWKASFIDRHRVDESQLPDQYTSVVSVDPAASNTMESNWTGIIVVAAGPKPGVIDPEFRPIDDEPTNESEAVVRRRIDSMHGYIVKDGSIQGTPDAWARRAVALFHEYECKVIVAEANQGGDMVKHTLHSVDPTVPVRLVHATKNKQTRAEPIVALYEQGRVHHLNPRDGFRKLEQEMLEWDPEISPKSPDRLDALVWGVHYLLVQKRVRNPVAPLGVGQRDNPWRATELPVAA